MTNQNIAMEILNQMGGMGKIKMMVNGKDFLYGENWIQFKFSGSKKMNIVKIKLNSMDLYEVKFYKYYPRKMELVELKNYDGIYCDQLKELFENTTGLYLSLN